MYFDNNFDFDGLQDFDELDELDEFDESNPICPFYQLMWRQLPPPMPPFFNMPPNGHGPMGGPVGAPPGAPPSETPSKAKAESQLKAVSPGSIRPCLYRYVYIWLSNGSSFWAWLTYIDRRTASGFRWQGRRWVYFGVDLRKIDSFICY